MTISLPPANLAVIRAFAPVFGLLGGALSLGVAAFCWLGIAIDAGSWRTVGLVAGIAVVLVLAAARLGNETATSSALSVAFFLAIPAPLAIFSYACAGIGAGIPLADAVLAGIDDVVGFDWTGTVAWFNRSPNLVWLLDRAYHGTIVSLIYVLVMLNVLGRRDRIVEFMWLFAGSCLVASLVSGVIPAIGAYAYYRPEDAMRTAIAADSGIWHLAHFEALRVGTFSGFSLNATQGLITFPSFHTAAALTVPLALRGLGVVTGLAWAVAGTIIVSTIPIGGHYLIDVIAGAAMTLALYGLTVRWFAREIRLPLPSPLTRGVAFTHVVRGTSGHRDRRF